VGTIQLKGKFTLLFQVHLLQLSVPSADLAPLHPFILLIHVHCLSHLLILPTTSLHLPYPCTLSAPSAYPAPLHPFILLIHVLYTIHPLCLSRPTAFLHPSYPCQHPPYQCMYLSSFCAVHSMPTSSTLHSPTFQSFPLLVRGGGRGGAVAGLLVLSPTSFVKQQRS
jgi:hypothetical protein